MLRNDHEHVRLCPQVILKEREGKKGKPLLDSDVAGAEEEEHDSSLSFTEDLTQEHLTPDGE